MASAGRAAVAVGAVAVAVNAIGLLWRPGFLASPGGEIYGHAFVQGIAAETWPALPREAARLWPAAPWVVIDPLPTWLAAGVAQLVGPVAGYNALVFAGFALAAAGGARLASVTGGNPVVGALVLAWAPTFLGSATSGLTEDLGLGLVALTVAELLRVDGPDRRAVAAGALLAVTAACGLYLVVIAALAAAILGAARLVRAGTGRRRLAAGLAVVATLGALGLAVVAAPHQGRLAGRGHHAGVPPERIEVHWRLNPVGGDDLVSFVAPGRDAPDVGAMQRVHPGYLGLTVLGLAALGARGQRRWLVVVGAGVALAAGPRLRVVGLPSGWPNPIVVVARLFPPLQAINHWGRLLPLAELGLVVLASRGAQRRPSWAIAAVAADMALLSPVAPWLPTTDAAVPPIWTALADLPAGAIVVVPSAGPGVVFQRPLWFALAQPRAVSLHPSRPGYGAAEEIPLTRWFAGLPGDRRDPPDPEVEASMRELRRRGIGVILAQAPYAPDVASRLGTPDVVVGDDAAWGVP